jgi:hypothetical protein
MISARERSPRTLVIAEILATLALTDLSVVAVRAFPSLSGWRREP